VEKINIEQIREEAEQLYLNGDFYCSEAVIATIRKHIAPDMPEQIIATGSGFPVGIGGSMCVCGAVSGGVIVLGYFFGRVNPKDTKVRQAMSLSKELHDFFQSNFKVLCCRTLCKGMELGSKKHKEQCAKFTGAIAEKTAEIIIRELMMSEEK
jgi:C_GCAxxG_C_C family probable redox protein